MNKILTTLFLLFSALQISFSQTVILDGYAFASGNRGYLESVEVTLEDLEGNVLGRTLSDADGHFIIETVANPKYKVTATHDAYNERIYEIEGVGETPKDKIFLKLELVRAPGYTFEITLAEKRDSVDVPTDGISGARIDAYNNTTEKEVFVLDNYTNPKFDVNMKKGNHYTILIRKEGYIAKRIEAFVNVNGCILCVEGLGSLNPGVTENLSANNQIGVLLANVELEKIRVGKKLEVQNIYYDFGSARITNEARKQLNTLITMMNDTPELLLELGSHTDSRGGTEANLKLSDARAKSAVKYIRDGGIGAYRISARGYGENILKNECSDGVPCTEAQHAENRRTELKIVGLSDISSRIKSLAEIKQAEKAEAMLKEFQFGGQVELPEGMSIKDLSDDEVVNMVKQLKAEKEAELKTQQMLESDSLQVEEIIEEIEEEKVFEEIEEEEIIEEIEEEVLEEIHAEKINEKLVQQEQISAEIVETNKSVSNAVIENANFAEEKRLDEGMIIRKEKATPVITSYRIVIKHTESELDESHDLFSRHSDLLEFIDKSNAYNYLIGNFDTVEKAKQFLNGSVKMVYPDAYIVQLANDKLIRIN